MEGGLYEPITLNDSKVLYKNNATHALGLKNVIFVRSRVLLSLSTNTQSSSKVRRHFLVIILTVY